MILIFGDKADYCINMVIDWLDIFNLEYFLIDNNDTLGIQELNFEKNKFIIKVENEIVDLGCITSVFNWRGVLKLAPNLQNIRGLNMGILNHLYYEKVILKDYLVEYLIEKRGV